MTSTRGPWIGYLLAGLSIAAAPMGFPAARAQGFGPDPYKPFNHQYEQYVYPTNPGLTGQAGMGPFRRVDNQFQQWLTEQEGADAPPKSVTELACSTGSCDPTPSSTSSIGSLARTAAASTTLRQRSAANIWRISRKTTPPSGPF